MKDFYDENNSLISFEQLEVAASEIVFLKKIIAYLNAEITATYKEYDVDREVEAIYWLQPFIRVIGGQLFDSNHPEVEDNFKEEIDVLVSLRKDVHYIVYLNGTRELILPKNKLANKEWGFREFLYILLNTATTHLKELQNATNFLSGLETNEVSQ